MESQVYADELSEDEIESDNSGMNCDVLMQYKREKRIHQISESECSSTEEELNIE